MQTMTTQHQRKMQAGKRRADAQRAREKARAERAYTKWVKEDARLYAAMLQAREIGTGAERARRKWLDHLGQMPAGVLS